MRLFIRRLVNNENNTDYRRHVDLDLCPNRNVGVFWLTRMRTHHQQGAYWHKRYGKWVALIRTKGRLIYLGGFDSKRAAINAHDAVARGSLGGGVHKRN